MPLRQAISVIQVIAVISLIAVAIGLMLPAICSVRQAAARSRCTNNLRQLGVAVYNYVSADRDKLPYGVAPDTSLPVDQRLSFNAILLPFIESNDVYRKLQKQERWDSPRNSEAVMHYGIKVFQCPEWVEETWKPTQEHPMFPSDHRAPTNYVGIGGLGLDAGMLPLDDVRVGMLGYERQLKITDVKDGTENTILMLESGDDPGPWMRVGIRTLRGIDTANLPVTGEGRQFGGMHRSSSYSFLRKKPVGGNILLAYLCSASLKDS
jgi:hypothetical protein